MSRLRDAEKEHILVAIDPHLMHPLHVTRLLTLEPQTVSGTRKIDRATRGCRELQSLTVHPRKHEHVFAVLFLGDDGQKPLLVPLQLGQPIVLTCVVGHLNVFKKS